MKTFLFSCSRCVVALLCLVPLVSLQAQGAKQREDLKAIQGMCGCFEISFFFAEAFNYSSDTAYKASEPYEAHALELALPIEESPDKVSIQHLLVIGNPAKPHIIKHWRQDWMYAQEGMHVYAANNQWRYEHIEKKQAKGRWVHQVYQVDDSPRYQDVGRWTHAEGRSYFESVSPAPLPRREYTKRSDYNLMLRRNRYEITDYGWTYDQDNDKVLRSDGEADQLIARERGYSVYRRVQEDRCAAARRWWNEQQAKWQHVRSAFASIMTAGQDLQLHPQVEGEPLYEHLYPLPTDASSEEIAAVVKNFVK